jgi:hypothetical protein
MHFFTDPSRREVLKSTAAIAASFILPRSIFARTTDRSYWFLHADNQNSWPIADPVRWSLENASQPVLERAVTGLLKLTTADGDRIIRLVTRRCRLNLIELHPERVVVHHWGQQGLADLRAFFKMYGLARKEIEVVVKDRKREGVTTQSGEDFLFGDRLAADWPLELFLSKWESRLEQQSDDRTAAPGTWSGYAWEGVENNRIPWAALKSAWRRTSPMLCHNCDQPTILVNFGLRPVGMFNRKPSFVHVCGECCRSFRDESIRDVAGWMKANLDAEARPDFEMVWNRRVKLEPNA